MKHSAAYSCAIATLLGLGFLLVYASVLPDRLTRANYGGDGGDFLAAMLTRGIPHPSGYPVYLALGRLFLLLPQGSPYARVALLSATAGALAVGLAFLWMRYSVLRGEPAAWLAALAAALSWGSTPLVWSQAVIVEVHALQAVFVLALLGWIALLSEESYTPLRRTALLGLSLLGGLSLGNHLTILLLFPALLAAQLAALRRGMPRGLLAAQGAGLLAGAMVYLWLPWLARQWPAVNWGNAQSWQGFVWLVGAAPYRGLLFAPLPGLDWLARIISWAQMLVTQFSLPGILLGAIGLVFAGNVSFAQRVLLGWIFASYTLFSVGYQTYDSVVYLIPAYLAFAAWIGAGMSVLWSLAWRNWALGRWACLVFLLFGLVRLPFVRSMVDARQESGQAVFAEDYLRRAPQNAILMAAGDSDSFPLWYYHLGLGWRTDVRVVVQPLTQFRWYQETLLHTYPDLVAPPFEDRQDGAWADRLAALNPERPLCRSFEQADAVGQVAFTCQEAPAP